MSVLDRPFLKTTEDWSAADLARFKAHGYAAINYQAQNGASTKDFDLAPAKAAGLVAEVWGVTYFPSAFYRDGKLLGQQAVKLGAQGVTMNAEMCAKFTRATRGLLPIIQGLRDGGWSGPVSLNTLGAPSNPDVNDFEMDIQSFLETGGGIACQAYVNAYDDYHPALCARYWRRMGVVAGRLNLTLGLYDPRSENPTKRQLTGAEYVPMVQQANVGKAISIFRPETSFPNDLKELEAITLATEPNLVTPQAAAAPATLDAIKALAREWEAIDTPKPLSRITIIRRIATTTTSQWRAVNEEIKLALDRS